MNTRLYSPNAAGSESLADYFHRTRALMPDLCRTLAPEDMVVQSMPDASPAKWHLAHTTWFFENFILVPCVKDYRPFHALYGYLFNSYYQGAGPRYARFERGLLSRPTVAEILGYREYVNEHMQRMLSKRSNDAQFEFLVTLGLNHEQQHQELLLTDIKHMFSLNPLKPAWRELPPARRQGAAKLEFIARPEGLVQIGHDGDGFAFDNETPRHHEFLRTHKIANRMTTNSEYREFIRAGGYGKAQFWLSDGWATLQREGWNRPLYWSEDLNREFTLSNEREIDPGAPVCHLSYYEADAYARWAGARLPTEAEWESFAATQPVTGHFLDSGLFHPATDSAPHVYGDVWQWTSSAYSPYPGYRPLAGTLGEYNGKFMANQLVLRGGSCATPADHIRASYRNFFYPHQRWQFTGLRLAKDN